MIVSNGAWLSFCCCCCCCFVFCFFVLFCFVFVFSCFFFIFCFFRFFLRGGNRCLSQHRRNGFSLITITPVGAGNLKLWRTKADGTDYLSMRFQFWSMSENSRVRTILTGSSVRVCLVVLNQGCCGFGQYNLPDRMLRLDLNTTVNQSYVLFITLVNITYQRGKKYLPSTHYWDSSPWQVLYIPLLLIIFHFSRTLF